MVLSDKQNQGVLINIPRMTKALFVKWGKWTHAQDVSRHFAISNLFPFRGRNPGDLLGDRHKKPISVSGPLEWPNSFNRFRTLCRQKRQREVSSTEGDPPSYVESSSKQFPGYHFVILIEEGNQVAWGVANLADRWGHIEERLLSCKVSSQLNTKSAHQAEERSKTKEKNFKGLFAINQRCPSSIFNMLVINIQSLLAASEEFFYRSDNFLKNL